MHNFLRENDLYNNYGDNICDICIEIDSVLSCYNSDDGIVKLAIALENDVFYQVYLEELPLNSKHILINLNSNSISMRIVNTVIDAHNQLVTYGDMLPLIEGELNKLLYVTAEY